jgi:hypothetical protein
VGARGSETLNIRTAHTRLEPNAHEKEAFTALAESHGSREITKNQEEWAGIVEE